jgi:hypothetical protein
LEVGGKETVDVGGEVEDEDEEGEEDGKEVTLVEVDGGKMATYYGVEIVDVEAEQWGERSCCLMSSFYGIRLWQSSSSSDDESEIRIEFSASWIQMEKRKRLVLCGV